MVISFFCCRLYSLFPRRAVKHGLSLRVDAQPASILKPKGRAAGQDLMPFGLYMASNLDFPLTRTEAHYQTEVIAAPEQIVLFNDNLWKL